jgi:D-3-phosphoglycerate dehydrogenase
MALGLGMKVIAADSFIPQVDIKVTFFDGQSITTTIVSQPLNSLFKEADFITLHVSWLKKTHKDTDNFLVN